MLNMGLPEAEVTKYVVEEIGGIVKIRETLDRKLQKMWNESRILRRKIASNAREIHTARVSSWGCENGNDDEYLSTIQHDNDWFGNYI